MRLVGVISTTVLSLTLGLAASAYAQEQHDQKEEEKAKPAQQDEKKASPDKPSQTEKKAAEKQKDNAGREEKATQQRNKDGKPEQTNERQQVNERQQTNERQQPQHEQAQPEQRTKGGSDHGGGRIPEDRYRAHFGQEHRFHVSQADYGRDRRFQYGGYTFGFVDEWPGNWLYTQDVFVIEIDGVYYLCNPTYPGVNIALSVVL
jgi:cell division protein FtsN